MPYFMGIDIGSSYSKAVIVKDEKIIEYHVMLSGINHKETANKLKDDVLGKAGILFNDIEATAATGQGASNALYADEVFDDIKCCARGIYRIFPTVRTIIDVQGQNARVIRLNDTGGLLDFAVSEKCAAGSGRFLQVIASILRVSLADIGRFSLESKKPVKFTTGCGVFWESEAISMISQGFKKEDILAGVHLAMASKFSSLVDRIGVKEDFAVSGGGGLDTGLIKQIETKLGVALKVPEMPQAVTALGAAILAAAK